MILTILSESVLMMRPSMCHLSRQGITDLGLNNHPFLPQVPRHAWHLTASFVKLSQEPVSVSIARPSQSTCTALPCHRKVSINLDWCGVWWRSFIQFISRCRKTCKKLVSEESCKIPRQVEHWPCRIGNPQLQRSPCRECHGRAPWCWCCSYQDPNLHSCRGWCWSAEWLNATECGLLLAVLNRIALISNIKSHETWKKA